MQRKEQLIPGKFYHIYNCGIDGTSIFNDENDYKRFITLYENIIDPIADTYAWCLMKNHFHFLVKLKENIKYQYSTEDYHADPERFKTMKWQTVDIDSNIVPNLNDQLLQNIPSDSIGTPINNISPVDEQNSQIKLAKIPKAHLHFSHLFNAYAKYFNKKYKRHGSLFEREFKRKQIVNLRQLKNTLLYIHNNPVHHHFCSHPMEYPWSSYLTYISIKPTKIRREEAIGWFNDKAEFVTKHDERIDLKEIEKWLEI